MGNYLDKTYAAIDGILLSYEGKDVHLKIPPRLDNMEIHTIGNGAVMESENLQQVIVPDGIKRIGENSFSGCDQLVDAYLPYSVTSFALNAFRDCPKLSNLFIYGIELNEQKYRDLRDSSRRVNDSVYLAQYFPDLGGVKDAVASTDARTANYIQSGITRLFVFQSLQENTGEASLRRGLGGIGFESKDRYVTETGEFLRLIADQNVYDADALSEEKNDRFLKSEKFPTIEKTAVFTFDDSKTKRENGKYIIIADIKIGYHFWQSKVPVNLYGNNYYIYRRHYLTSRPELNYIREDVAVFTNKGIVSNRKEAQEVYAKYKLLSIL